MSTVSEHRSERMIPGIDFWAQLLPDSFDFDRLRIDGSRSLIHHGDLRELLGLDSKELLKTIEAHHLEIEMGWLETDENGDAHAWLEPQGVLVLVSLVETDRSRALRLGLIRHYVMLRSTLASQVEQVRIASTGSQVLRLID